MIPKNIFQTHKSLSYINSKPKVAKAVSSWLKYKIQNNFKYYFFTDAMCDTFMSKYFSGKVYEAYKRLPMAVMKADLWRYCIIYKYGGIYADSDTVCKANPNIFITDAYMTIVPENTGALCQWVFSGQKDSPILKSIIDLSVERILAIPEIKGEHIIHYLTGPSLFTDGIENYLRENNKPVFDDRKKYFKYPDQILKVFNADYFHANIVQHLFTGDDNDGWKKERYRKLI